MALVHFNISKRTDTPIWISIRHVSWTTALDTLRRVLGSHQARRRNESSSKHFVLSEQNKQGVDLVSKQMKRGENHSDTRKYSFAKMQ